jgi:septum formation protein
MKVILASKSPRRLELLSMIGCEVTTLVSDVDESKISAQTPEMLALALSKAKADAVYNILKDDSIPIVAADTLVCVENEILGKPKDRNDAKRMLKLLSDKAHQVHTGYTVLFNGRSISCCDTSDVIFRQILDSELEAYLDSNEPYDKAGAYGIQGKAGAFVERIEGDYFSIMGLPICKISKILLDLN